MELNLRKARKLDSKIEQLVSNLKSKIEMKKSVRVNADIQSEILPALVQARVDFMKDIDNIQNLIEARYNIRGMISKANDVSGISVLITSKITLENQISTINDLLRYFTVLDIKELEDDINITKSQLASGSRFVQSSHSANFLSSIDETEYKKKQLVLAKNIEAKEDKLLELNFATKVKLSNKLISLLQDNNLL